MWGGGGVKWVRSENDTNYTIFLLNVFYKACNLCKILLAELIDRVFEDDDYDGDGYLSYIEYVLARRRDEEIEKRKKQSEKPTDKL